MSSLGPPHPLLSELLYDPAMAGAQQDVLPYLLAVDAAHVVMLSECRLIDLSAGAALLCVNRELTERCDRGGEVLTAPPGHRGVYFVYEREYIERLGAAFGGAAHLARSRNDINAAIARMRAREAVFQSVRYCGDLIEATIRAARAHVNTVFSGFSHLQPAQPATLGHYLAGVGFSLLRSAELLDAAFEVLNKSPMGAAAGYGTSLKVDRERVADLLGFSGVVENSLDSVASRDYAVHVLHGLATLGVTITRLATDLHAWSSRAYQVIDWPDDLVSTSSIMPQKRNAFVLENIRGEATCATGALVTVLMGMKNVPFANSIEAGSDVMTRVWPAFASTDRAMRLMALMLQHLRVSRERAREFAVRGDTAMTALADRLVVNYGLPFRTAHRMVRESIGGDARGKLHGAKVRRRLEKALVRATGRPIRLPSSLLTHALDVDRCVRAAACGGGPAPDVVRTQIETLAHGWEQVRERFLTRQKAIADAIVRRRAAEDALTRRFGRKPAALTRAGPELGAARSAGVHPWADCPPPSTGSARRIR